MKQALNRIALFKKADAILQVCIFIALSLACLFHVNSLLYLMLAFASYQVVSCITWSLYFQSNTLKYPAGTLIRRTFFIILLILLLTVLLIPAVFFFLVMVMLFAGPVCGALYFMITLKEFHFYSKARKPYYLL